MAGKEHEKKEVREYKFDRLFVRRFLKCLRIPFCSIFSDSSMMFMLLLGLCLTQQLVYYNVGLLASEFMQVLGNKDGKAMKNLVIKSLILILTVSVVKSAVKAVSGYLYLHWRKCITLFLHNGYLSNHRQYLISSDLLPCKVDNADQRMTQDVDRFCLQLSSISADIVISPLVILYYSVQCFSVNGVMGPLIIYAYFITGTLMNKVIMSFIVNMVYIQEQREGDFRFKHVQIRNFAESISMIKSEKHEKFKLNGFFELLLQVQKKIVNLEIFLNISTNIIDYIGSILSYIIISIPIFAGKYDKLSSVELSSLISKNTFVSMYLINCFSTLIDLSSQFTDISGYTHRIGELIEAISIPMSKNINFDGYDHSLISDNESNESVLCSITDLSYSSPVSEKNLVTDLNIVIKKNQNLLITGNTGTGKSSLFRILSEIWQPFCGRFRFHLKEKEKVMFLPQNPILTNGSLFDQVIYPLLQSDIENYSKAHQEVLKALEDVGLLHLVKRSDSIDNDPLLDWSQQLSPGEIQRLTFARLFFHRPTLVFMDEATSSLGLSEEDCFYRYCNILGITMVSVGHRSSLKPFHHSCLKIKGDGSWDLFVIDK